MDLIGLNENKIKRMLIGFVVIILLFSLQIKDVFACEENDSSQIHNVIYEIANTNLLFSSWQDDIPVLNIDYSSEAVFLYEVWDPDDKIEGYLIVDDNNNVLSYSLNRCLDQTVVSIIEYFSQNGYEGNNYVASKEKTCLRTVYNVLPGLSVQLNGSYSSHVGAVANIIWYLYHNGYSYLSQTNSWTSVIGNVNTVYSSLSGNNIIGKLLLSLSGYVMYYAQPHQLLSSSSLPDIAYIMDEIDAGRPVLVHHATGNPFLSTSDYSTMACGYQYLNQSWYVYLATGQQIAPTFYAWNSCTIDALVFIDALS